MTDNRSATPENLRHSLGGFEISKDKSKLTDDGIALGPIDVAHRGWSIPARPQGAWTIIQQIDHRDVQEAFAQIKAELAGDAGGLSFIFSESARAERGGSGLHGNFSAIAKGLPPLADRHLRLEGGFSTYAAMEAFIGCKAESTTFAFDPLAEGAAAGGFSRSLVDVENALVTTAQSLEWHERRGAAAIADGRIWNSAGASEAQELAGILGALTHYVRLLTAAGLPPATAIDRIALTVAADPHAVLTIAKLRAARLLHARFVELLDLPPVPALIHAETSWRIMTRQAPQLNILRTTSAALAAGIGGADSISVLPFTSAVGQPDDFARRLARASQILLIEEAGVHRVADPAAGSGTIEAVTEALSEKAWEQFRAIEAEGGLLAALRSGSLQRDIAGMRESRATKLEQGDTAIVGVTAYADSEIPTAHPAENRASPSMGKAEMIEAVAPIRFAAPFET